jgi:hypothetical protein
MPTQNPDLTGLLVAPKPASITGSLTLSALAHAGRLLLCNSASAINLTLSTDAAGGWTDDDRFDVYQVGSGKVTVLAGSATLSTPNGTQPSTSAQGRFQSFVRTGANTWAPAQQLDNYEVSLNYLIPVAANQSYAFIEKCVFPGVVTEVTTKCGAGSCTLVWQINGVSLGGTANTVSTSRQDQPHSSSNVFAIGDSMSALISSNSGATSVSLTVKYRRTAT